MNTLQFSLGIKPFIPPSGLVITHTMYDDDDQPQEAAAQSNYKKRIENTKRVLNAIRNGYYSSLLISREARLTVKTVRSILVHLVNDGFVGQIKRNTRGGIHEFHITDKRYEPA